MRGGSITRNVCLTLVALIVPFTCGFVVYGWGRGWTFMPPLDRMVLAMGLTGVFPTLFLMLWAWCAWELACFAIFGVRQRRIGRGLCCCCKYQQSEPPSVVCPECGKDPFDVPAKRYPGTTAIVATLLLSGAASSLGALTAELWLTAEEQRFVEHIRDSGGAAPDCRDRLWPNENAQLVYNPPHGFHATD